MWTRRELKQNARKAMKKNYWRTVFVCLVLAVLIGAHSTFNIAYEITDAPMSNFEPISNTQLINSIINQLTGKQIIKNPDKSKTLKASNGVLAGLFNNITQAGSFFIGTLNAMNQFIFQNKFMAGTIIMIASILIFLFWLLVGNVLRVGECRFFVENRIYKNTRFSRLLYLYKLRKAQNTIKVMLLKTVFIVLWYFTIIGGIIKTYSYRMIPYILAENPDVDYQKAFSLSQDMMRGYKWKAFKLDLSFFLWNILGLFTFGFLSYLYVNPYKGATDAELFIKLRENAAENRYQYIEWLNDQYLTVSPLNNQNHQYPVNLYKFKENPNRKWINIDYHRKYSLVNIILMFFTFCFIGWIWEVGMHLYSDGAFINRGVLFGPWLPIYGSGGVLSIILLRKWIDKPAITFLLAFVMSGIVEYSTGWCLETYSGVRWWDYTGYLLNINGIVCLEGLLVFALAGCASIYIMAPLLDKLFNKSSNRIKIGLCALLVIMFIGDILYSINNPNTGEGITFSLINTIYKNYPLKI